MEYLCSFLSGQKVVGKTSWGITTMLNPVLTSELRSHSGTWLKLSHRYGTELERNSEQSRMFERHCCRVGGSRERRHSGGQAVRQTKTKTKSPWCNRELHQFKHLSIVSHFHLIVDSVYKCCFLMGIVLYFQAFSKAIGTSVKAHFHCVTPTRPEVSVINLISVQNRYFLVFSKATLWMFLNLLDGQGLPQKPQSSLQRNRNSWLRNLIFCVTPLSTIIFTKPLQHYVSLVSTGFKASL